MNSRYIGEMMERIVSTPGVRSGKPCIRGTRITVTDMLEYMAGGDTIETLVLEFPNVTRDDLLACLAFAAECANQPMPIAAE